MKEIHDFVSTCFKINWIKLPSNLKFIHINIPFIKDSRVPGAVSSRLSRLKIVSGFSKFYNINEKLFINLDKSGPWLKGLREITISQNKISRFLKLI